MITDAFFGERRVDAERVLQFQGLQTQTQVHETRATPDALYCCMRMLTRHTSERICRNVHTHTHVCKGAAAAAAAAADIHSSSRSIACTHTIHSCRLLRKRDATASMLPPMQRIALQVARCEHVYVRGGGGVVLMRPLRIDVQCSRFVSLCVELHACASCVACHIRHDTSDTRRYHTLDDERQR